MADVFIYDALRTPRGRGKAGKGGLSNIHPQELLAQTLNHMAERKKLDKNLVEDVAIGCVTQVKEQGACIARNALIAAQWPEDVTGFTINRFCGSGLEAVNIDRREDRRRLHRWRHRRRRRVDVARADGPRRRDARRPQREAAQAPATWCRRASRPT